MFIAVVLNPNAHIFIFTQKITPRVKYIFNLIFKDSLGLEFTLTSSEDDYKLYEGFKLSYAKFAVESEFHITAHGLLFESGIHEQSVMIQNHETFTKVFFRTYNNSLPFDVFAASFYLVSRYEEYLPFKPDQFNRFEAENSLAYQHDFLRIPLVNLWIKQFQELLKKKFPNIKITGRTYRYISTIDIDNAFKYKQKGIMRSLGGYFKSFAKFDKNDLIDRTSVLLKKEKDPFDSYDYQLTIQKKYNLKVIYFYLLGDYGINDKNHPSNNQNFQKLIKHLSDYASPGIHPSFGSNGNVEQIKIEVNRLSKITHRDITDSRQHFSMLKFPDTYFRLQETGITDDYSMGYSLHNGFRASICQPFYWYDLDDEIETALKIHPFCISETSLRYKDHATPETAAEVAKPIIDEVKKYQGEMISIFHNDTMGTAQEWIEWHNVYEEIVKLSVE